jgi:DNA-binding LacI/PurR family transcriptional regulator
VAITSALDDPRLAVLRQDGLPMVAVSGASPLSQHFHPRHIPALTVPYLAEKGRRRIGLIAWAPPPAGTQDAEQIDPFRQALAAQGLAFHPEWCRVDLSYAARGAGWEEFREIWSALPEKPDALIITDENYLPEVVMAILQLGLRIPQDLLLVSHRARFIDYPLPIPVAWAEMDVAAFADCLAREALAVLKGETPSVIPANLAPFRLLPLAEAPEPVLPMFR